MLFQIVDDILDVTGTDAALGKPQGSDERHGKRTYVSEFGIERARELAAESHGTARGALAEVAAGGAPATARPASSRTSPTSSTRAPHEPARERSTARRTCTSSPTRSSATLAQEVREHIIDTVGEIGGHFGANLGTCELAVALHSLLDSPARQDPLGRRPPGLPAQGPHRPPRRALDDPPVRRARAVLLDRRVRARHHGRRPRLDLDRLRGRHQGGHAPGGGGEDGQGRRRDRRRRDDRRRRLRGDRPGRRPGHADRRRAQRQRHVDRAERRRALALLQPRPPEPEAVARALGHRGRADEAAGRHRRRVRAPRPAPEGVDQGVLGARACGGRSSTGPTWA